MYKFTRNGGGYDKDIKHKFDTPYATWFEVVGGFQVFLAKCGYVFPEEFDMSKILLKEHHASLEKVHKEPIAWEQGVYEW